MLLLRIHTIRGQRLERIVPPSLPPHHQPGTSSLPSWLRHSSRRVWSAFRCAEPPSFSFHPDKNWIIQLKHQKLKLASEDLLLHLYRSQLRSHWHLKRPYLHGSCVHIWRCRPFHLDLGWGFQWGRESHRLCRSSHTPVIPVRNYKSSLKTCLCCSITPLTGYPIVQFVIGHRMQTAK